MLQKTSGASDYWKCPIRRGNRSSNVRVAAVPYADGTLMTCLRAVAACSKEARRLIIESPTEWVASILRTCGSFVDSATPSKKRLFTWANTDGFGQITMFTFLEPGL